MITAKTANLVQAVMNGIEQYVENKILTELAHDSSGRHYFDVETKDSKQRLQSALMDLLSSVSS